MAAKKAASTNAATYLSVVTEAAPEGDENQKSYIKSRRKPKSLANEERKPLRHRDVISRKLRENNLLSAIHESRIRRNHRPVKLQRNVVAANAYVEEERRKSLYRHYRMQPADSVEEETVAK